jgi:hypothetical protein
MARRTRAQTAMNLSPEIIDAIGSQYKAMGFEFDPRGLARFRTGGPDVVGLASAMGLPPQEIARLLIEKFTVTHIEHDLPRCVRQFGDRTLMSMPLDDVRFVYGYMALVEAGATVSSEQTKRAIQIVCKLSLTETDAA